MVYFKRLLFLLTALTFLVISGNCSRCMRKQHSSGTTVVRAKNHPAPSLAPGVTLASFKISSVSIKADKTVLTCRTAVVHKSGPSAKILSAGSSVTIIVPGSLATASRKKKLFVRNKVFKAKIRHIPPGKNIQSITQYEVISFE